MPFRASISGGRGRWTDPALVSLTRLFDERGHTIVGGEVSAQADQAPVAGASLTNATVGHRPVEVLVNGLPGLLYDGGNDVLSNADALSTWITAGSWHVFVVFQAHTITPTSANPLLDAPILTGANGYWALAARKNGSVYELCARDDGGPQDLTCTGLLLDTTSLAEWSHGAGIESLTLNGGTPSAHAVAATGGLTNTPRVATNYNTAIFGNMLMCEIRVYNAHLTASQVASITAYLKAKWGVSLSGGAERAVTSLAEGDSIVAGYNGLTGGWRLKLLSALADARIAYVEVGGQTTGGGHHQGIAGNKIADVTSRIASDITTYLPMGVASPLLVISVGTNDLGTGRGVSSTETDFSALFATTQAAIAATNPAIRVLLTGIPKPLAGAYSVFGADYDAVNAWLPGQAASNGWSYAAPGSIANTHPTETEYATEATVYAIPVEAVFAP